MKDKPVYIICTPFFPTPTSWRGPFCYDFAKALMRTGKYDVRVFVPGTGDDYEYHGLKVYRFKDIALPLRLCPFLFDLPNKYLFYQKLRKVGIDLSNVAVFHTHEVYYSNFHAFIKRLNPRVKTVHHFHAMGHPFHVNTPLIGIVPIYSTLVYQYYKQGLKNIEIPVFVSERQRSMMGMWYPDGFLGESEDIRKRLTFGAWLKPVELKPSRVLYNGIDYNVFNSNGRQSNGCDFVIGDVANFCDTKDFMTLLKAVNRIKDVIPGLKCRLVGSGSTLSICQKYVADNGLEDVVEFIKEMDHLKLPDFYRSLDLFVSPSWAEGFCCTFMEAHGCGTPIIGCREVSVEEALPKKDWDKWLFPRQDDAALAKLIERYYHTRDKQVLSRDFNIDTLVSEFVKGL